MQHALLPVPQAMLWQLCMLPTMPLVLQIIPYRRFIEPPNPLMPVLP
jgi:hypothetical protein